MEGGERKDKPEHDEAIEADCESKGRFPEDAMDFHVLCDVYDARRAAREDEGAERGGDVDKAEEKAVISKADALPDPRAVCVCLCVRALVSPPLWLPSFAGRKAA